MKLNQSFNFLSKSVLFGSAQKSMSWHWQYLLRAAPARSQLSSSKIGKQDSTKGIHYISCRKSLYKIRIEHLKMTTWRDLPVEILSHILALLDTESRRNAANTCRRFCDIFRNDPRLANYLRINLFTGTGRFLKRTSDGSLCIDYGEFNEVLASFPKLKSLRVNLDIHGDQIDSVLDFPLKLDYSQTPLIEKVTLNVWPNYKWRWHLNLLSVTYLCWFDLEPSEFTFCPKCKKLILVDTYPVSNCQHHQTYVEGFSLGT